jgi:hypothetical protein
VLIRTFLSCAAALCGLAIPALAANNVTTWRYDVARTGQNLKETQLTPANVNSATFGKLYSYYVDGWVYAQPLYMASVNTAGGTHNMLFIATENDSLYAFDADHNQQLWRVSLIDTAHGAAPGAIAVPSADYGTGDLHPQIGITGTPVIDPSSNTLYVVAKSEENGTFVQRLHAIDITNGLEKPGSPVVIQGSVPGTGKGSISGSLAFQPKWQLQRPGLLLLNGQIYVGLGSHGDLGPYHGWIFAYDASTLQQTGVFASTPNGSEAGIWQSGAGLAADTVVSSGRLFVPTGNGTFDAAPPYTESQDFGDSVVDLLLNNGSMQVIDVWTPFDQASLSNADKDQGSGGVLLLPDQPGSHVHELIQAGKNGRIELLDRDNLGGYNTSSNQVVQEISGGTGMWSTPAYWNGHVYIWQSGGVLRQYTLSKGLLTAAAAGTVISKFPGASPVISSNGTSNGIVWDLVTDAYGSSGAAVLYAHDATNVSRQLYASNQNNRDTAGAAVKFTVPMVTNGRVYVGSNGEVDVYGLLAGMPSTTAEPRLSPAPGSYPSAQQVTITDSTSGATIYYTVDGTVPTTSSNLYSGPIPITGNTTVRAAAFSSGRDVSRAAYGNYQIGNGPIINLPYGFAGAAGFVMNGSATNYGDTRIHLVTGLTYQAGSAFWNRQVSVQNFTTDFQFQLSGTPPIADGMTFILQAESPTALGPAGSGLGYGAPTPGGTGGIAHSIAIKFDVHQNVNEGSDSTGLYVNGASPTTPSIDLSNTGIALNSGDPIQAHIVYDGTTLTMTLKDVVTGATYTTGFPIDVPQTIGSTTAYAGFTGGTGGRVSDQKILNWTYSAAAVRSPLIYEVETLSRTSSGQPFGTTSWSGFPDSLGAFLNAVAPGNFITFTINVPQADTYDLHTNSKNLNTRGIWQLSLDGINVGTPQDEYSSTVAYQDFDLGPVTISKVGNHTVTFTVTGKNASSTGYVVSLDNIRLIPQ